MKEMIKNYRGTLISSGLVILAGILVGFTSIQGKWLNVFFIVMQCALVTIIFYDNRNRQQSRKVIGMTIWIIPVITLIYNGIARLVNMGADTENLFMALIYYGTGLMFMVIGNYLPKVKQNNTIGIRVVWTLFWGSIEIRFEDTDFTIEAQGWSDYTVDYTQIDSISYEENLLQNSNDYRTNGLGNFKYAMGNFRNDVYGNYIRYTHSSCHSYVVMSVDGKILVINGENDSATEEIYHTISEKMSRELE